jgi:hypothetical protein
MKLTRGERRQHDHGKRGSRCTGAGHGQGWKLREAAGCSPTTHQPATRAHTGCAGRLEARPQGQSAWGMGTHLRASARVAATTSVQGVCEGHATMARERDGRRTRGEGGEKYPCVSGNRCPSRLRSAIWRKTGSFATARAVFIENRGCRRRL